MKSCCFVARKFPSTAVCCRCLSVAGVSISLKRVFARLRPYPTEPRRGGCVFACTIIARIRECIARARGIFCFHFLLLRTRCVHKGRGGGGIRNLLRRTRCGPEEHIRQDGESSPPRCKSRIEMQSAWLQACCFRTRCVLKEKGTGALTTNCNALGGIDPWTYIEAGRVRGHPLPPPGVKKNMDKHRTHVVGAFLVRTQCVLREGWIRSQRTTSHPVRVRSIPGRGGRNAGGASPPFPPRHRIKSAELKNVAWNQFFSRFSSGTVIEPQACTNPPTEPVTFAA